MHGTGGRLSIKVTCYSNARCKCVTVLTKKSQAFTDRYCLIILSLRHSDGEVDQRKTSAKMYFPVPSRIRTRDRSFHTPYTAEPLWPDSSLKVCKNCWFLTLTSYSTLYTLKNILYIFIYLWLFGLWGYWHCGHSWPNVPASGDSEDDCGEADGM
jgi:hypothetical protein